MLSKAKPAPLPELVYSQLRSAILNGAFRPGEMLPQEDIARRLGVSRGPLREVLPRLEADGLVTLYPRRGYAVTALNPDDIVELFELRRMLEVKLVRLAVGVCSDADVSEASLLNKRATRYSAVGVFEKRVAWADLNNAFHRRLLMPSGKAHHLRMLESLCAQLEPYIRMEITLTGDLEEAQREHNLLIEAFEARDSEFAAAITEQHIQKTEQRLLSALHNSAVKEP